MSSSVSLLILPDEVMPLLKFCPDGFDGTITAATYAVISSEFNAANSASWLTTSYLVTSTAFQPLYGRVSDIFGRRVCFFISTITFALGCLGCSVSNSIVFLNCMRALTGFGGGGLMTMGMFFCTTQGSNELLIPLTATIVNSDMIPFRKRGMYQALQNGMFGFGAICGASFGGSIADGIGWRWCFLLQVPVSAFALVVGALVVKNPEGGFDLGNDFRDILTRVDFTGSLLLVTAISIQLVGLSLGGNELPWSSPWVVGSLVGSFALFAVFFVVEARTRAIPIIPLRLLHGRLPMLIQLANVCVGLSAYAVSFPPWQPRTRSLTACTVPFQPPTVLSDRAFGLGNHSGCTAGNSITRNPYRRSYCGSGHVEVGEVDSSRENWSDSHGCWKRLGDLPCLRRLLVEIFCLHLPSESGPGNCVSSNFVHVTGHF